MIIHILILFMVVCEMCISPSNNNDGEGGPNPEECRSVLLLFKLPHPHIMTLFIISCMYLLPVCYELVFEKSGRIRLAFTGCLPLLMIIHDRYDIVLCSSWSPSKRYKVMCRENCRTPDMVGLGRVG